MNDAIIISDIHLGSDVSQCEQLIVFLENIKNDLLSTKELIINGDLFDSWDFRKLKKNHWKVLSLIRKLSKKIHVIWINGNHDGPAEIISHLIGVDFFEEYTLISKNKKILILHGDKFDSFISKYPIFTKFADNIYRFIQKIDKSFFLAKLAKKSSKTFLRCSEQIKEKAKYYGKIKKVDAVICSHTHLPIEDKNGIEYYNTGCWTEIPCHYIEIKEGNVEIKIFS